jgi:hypothetical protein
MAALAMPGAFPFPLFVACTDTGINSSANKMSPRIMMVNKNWFGVFIGPHL